MAAPTLGPFEVQSFLARGGMGAVWAGIHTTARIPVAIKVLTGPRAQRAKFRKAFRDEVRAVARLSHPGIVGVLDFGEVSTEVAEATGASLEVGSPYLVMRRAAGSLRDAPTPRRWAEVAAILDQLLAALGHAHANGVLHRDLKPGNVLVRSLKPWGDGPIAPCFEALELADFGLARIGDDPTAAGGEARARGTPWYMAPEQGMGLWRDHGPWTDLYAVGCIVWELVTGRPPFSEDSRSIAIQAHISRDLPDMSAALPVPVDLEAWLGRLLNKDPYRRFSCAADARSALQDLGPPSGIVTPRVSVVGAALTWSDSLLSTGDMEVLASTRVESTVEPFVPSLPEIPEDWRAATAPQATLLLPGAGLGIYGLRTVPIAGRQRERDQMWAALRLVAEERCGQVLVLEGAAGRGKSRLAGWVTSLAAEIGAATALRAQFDADQRSELLGVIRRYLKTSDQTTESIETRLASRWPDGADAWTGLARALSGEAQPSSREEMEMFARWLGRIGSRRPVVLWLDDVHWSSTALEFAARLSGASLPVLVVCTVRSEDVDTAGTRQTLERVCTGEYGTRIALEPLGVEAHAELVRDLLGLHPRLSDQVVTRTAGNPLFAVQLVGDWVNRGVLIPGDGGFVVRPGAPVDIPSDVRTLCEARMLTLAEAAGEKGLLAVELAAAIGLEVRFDEWTAAARVGAVEIPDRLLDVLLSRRLARRIDNGWAFEHGLLREVILAHSEAAGRLRVHHLSCARMLQSRPGAQLARLGRHLAAAGRYAEALDPLGRGAWNARIRGDRGGLSQALDVYATAVAALDLDDRDPALLRLRTLQAWRAMYSGDLALAEELASKTALLRPDDAIREECGEARFIVAQVARTQGRVHEATAGFLEVLELLAGDERAILACYRGLGAVARDIGRLDEAEAWYLKALDTTLSNATHSHTWHALGAISSQAGRTEEARERLERALALCRKGGSAIGTVEALNGLADIARYEGDLDEAERGYRHALAELRKCGFYSAVTVRLNLAQLSVTRGDSDVAAQEIALAEAEYQKRDDRRFMGVCAILRAEVNAIRGDWTAAEQALDDGEAFLEQTGFTDPDVAHAFERLAALAAGSQDALNARATKLADGQWKRLRPPSG